MAEFDPFEFLKVVDAMGDDVVVGALVLAVRVGGMMTASTLPPLDSTALPNAYNACPISSFSFRQALESKTINTDRSTKETYC